MPTHCPMRRPASLPIRWRLVSHPSEARYMADGARAILVRVC
jgi:hypothetical protein